MIKYRNNKLLVEIFMNKFLALVLISFLSLNTIAVTSEEDAKEGNLTDEDKVLMDNFIHTGKQQREAKEAQEEVCAAKGYDASKCQSLVTGGDATRGEKFGGMSPNMIKALAQAYTMIVGLGGIGGKLDTKKEVKKDKPEPEIKKKGNSVASSDSKSGSNDSTAKQSPNKNAGGDSDTNSESTEKTEEKDDEQEDYCKYIAVGGEMIAKFTQEKEDEFLIIDKPPEENAQRANLEKQKRSHQNRIKTVDMQIGTWGATTGCYALMLSPAGPAAVDSISNWLKLAGAGLLTSYYMWEKGVHEEAVDAVDAIIKKLRTGKGDCNPVTERDCYCSEPDTMNDVKWCMPQIRTRMANDNKYHVTCVNSELKTDPSCKCVANDTCLDKNIRTEIADMHIPGALKGALNPYFEMVRGSMEPGLGKHYLNSNSNKLFAIAKKMLRENEDKVGLPDRRLSESQKQVAKGLAGLGLPKSAAAAFAAMKPTKEAEKNAEKMQQMARIGRFNLYKRNKNKNYLGKNYNGSTFSGGSGLKDSKKSGGRNNDYMRDMMKKFNKKRGGSRGSNAKVIRFAEKARQSAAITRNKSVSIFKILSRRYQLTATKRLEIKN
jgi:hypothetical protein